MGALTLLSLVVGAFLGGLVIVAIFVAGWETLRQREALEMRRRDRAVFAATSPLPLATAASGGTSAAPLRAPGIVAGTTPASGQGTRREPNWIETRPMVLRHAPATASAPAPAVDDETRVTRTRELDLLLD
jgi:hypothetical protein